MNLYITCSHLYVPITLTLSIKDEGRCIIYTDKRSVADLFMKIDADKYTCIVEESEKLRTLKDIFNISRYKKYLKKYFNSARIDNIYFFHEGYCAPANWLMMYLHKQRESSIFYIPVASSLNWLIQFRSPSLYCFYLKALNLFLWGYSIIPIKHQGIYYPLMAEKYYKKIDSEQKSYLFDYELISQIISKNLLKLSEYSPEGVVILQNVRIGENLPHERYEILLEELLERLPAGTQVYFKMHPDNCNYFGKEKILKEIPPYVSGNLLLKRFKCFIGYDSAMLAEAAEMGTKSISLLKMLPTVSDLSENLYEYMLSLSESVLYPSTLDEFISMYNTNN